MPILTSIRISVFLPLEAVVIAGGAPQLILSPVPEYCLSIRLPTKQLTLTFWALIPVIRGWITVGLPLPYNKSDKKLAVRDIPKKSLFIRTVVSLDEEIPPRMLTIPKRDTFSPILIDADIEVGYGNGSSIKNSVPSAGWLWNQSLP